MSASRKDGRPQGPAETAGVSRRGFLKGAGLTVAAVGMTGPGAIGSRPGGRQDEEIVPVIGEDGVEIALLVNGETRKVAARPATTLLDLLRNQLDVTGPKRVCDRGACGACSVLLDGRLVTSCSVLALDAAGRSVTTVEGLAGPAGELSPLQSAFVECDALQCGFCTPGMIVACTALLASKPQPTRAEAAEGIAGNICRCGTYDNILDAVALAARGGAKERRR